MKKNIIYISLIIILLLLILVLVIVIINLYNRQKPVYTHPVTTEEHNRQILEQKEIEEKFSGYGITPREAMYYSNE